MSTNVAATDKWAQPQQVCQLDMAFGGRMGDLLPPMSEIPPEFGMCEGNPYTEFVSRWFFNGADTSQLTPREGIDKNTALRHIQTILGSFEPQHEHKEAGAGYLLSRWFTLSAQQERRG